MDNRIVRDILIDELKKEGTISIRVNGGSMSPVIRDGSIVKIRNSKFEIRNKKDTVTRYPSPGTIICYKSGDWFLIHRVKSINQKSGLITVEGDSRDTVVHKIKKSAIIGVVKESTSNRILRIPAIIIKNLKHFYRAAGGRVGE